MATIFISAGEASGDLLGADLARALLRDNPQVKLTGMGGERMRRAGVTIIVDSKKLSVVGLFEVVTHLPSILFTWYKIKKYLARTKPQLVILIDFPDTHFRIMKYAKKYGIPVLYYVSPQIWAWRASRIHTLKKYIDHMAVLFAFEEKIYKEAGIPVTFVGHPLAHIVKPSMPKRDAYAFFNIDADRKIIALFPGSRNSELKNHLQLMMDTVKIISEKKPNTQFVLVLANHFDSNKIALPAEIKIIQNNLYDLLQITDAAISVSGTVTLEIALMNVPLCVIYRLHWLTHWIADKLIRTKYIGLCNIVAEQLVAREFLQDKATPEAIGNEIIRLLSDENARQPLALVKKNLDNGDASQKLMDVVKKLL